MCYFCIPAICQGCDLYTAGQAFTLYPITTYTCRPVTNYGDLIIPLVFVHVYMAWGVDTTIVRLYVAMLY